MSAQKHMFVEKTVPPALRRRVARPAPVLLASSRSDDLSQIPVLLPREQWILIKVTSWAHVLQLAGTVIIPVMLCDRAVPGLDWPRGLEQLRRPSRPPTLILLSDLEAASFWQDAVGFGVFDLLFRPFLQERLITALDLARIDWEMRLNSDNRS